MFEMRIVRDAVNTMSGGKVEEARDKSTMPLDGSCLIRGGHVTEHHLGVLESRVVHGVGVIGHGVSGVISHGADGDWSAKLRQSHQSAAERRDRLNVRLVRLGQAPLPQLSLPRPSRWSP